MKKWIRSIVSMVIAMAVIISGSTPMAYGETLISSEEVARGLSFCREYPVTVQLQGDVVVTGEKDVPPVIVASRTLIPARAFFEAMGADVEWEEATRTVKITSDDVTVELIIDSMVTRVDGIETMLEVPAMIIDHDGDGFGSTMLPLRFVSEGLGFAVTWEEETRTASVAKEAEEPEEPQKPENPEGPVYEGEETPTFQTSFGELHVLNTIAREKLVVIDIGHGGKDSGAIANEDLPDEVYEKNINLEVGLRLRDLLDQAGFRYMYTRDSDVSMTLYERPAFANENEADIFVSLHNNSSERSAPRGTEVYYYSKVNEEGLDEGALYGIYSKDIASNVQEEMVAILGTEDRGEKESPKLAVLNKTSMPAIIVEGAFLSNPEDLAIITDPTYGEKYAYAVAKGLIEAMNKAFQ